MGSTRVPDPRAPARSRSATSSLAVSPERGRGLRRLAGRLHRQRQQRCGRRRRRRRCATSRRRTSRTTLFSLVLQWRGDPPPRPRQAGGRERQPIARAHRLDVLRGSRADPAQAAADPPAGLRPDAGTASTPAGATGLGGRDWATWPNALDPLDGRPTPPGHRPRPSPALSDADGPARNAEPGSGAAWAQQDGLARRARRGLARCSAVTGPRSPCRTGTRSSRPSRSQVWSRPRISGDLELSRDSFVEGLVEGQRTDVYERGPRRT